MNYICREIGKALLFENKTADVALGSAAAVLAAVAGATGLASTAGRVPAAIMALTAAALTAAARFLRCNERHEMNWRRVSAWQALARDASFARASEGYPGASTLYDTIQTVLARRIAIMEIVSLPSSGEGPRQAVPRCATASGDLGLTAANTAARPIAMPRRGETRVEHLPST